MSFTRAEDEKKHNRVVRAILTVLAMFGAGSNAIKMRHKPKLRRK